METMVRTNDGFEIAEVDLNYAAGNLMGTQQSGVLNLQIADIVKDRDLIPSKTSCVKNITIRCGYAATEHASMRAFT
jgi:ATP-dependent DNA helicase RecG